MTETMPPDLRALLLAGCLGLLLGSGLAAPARAATYEEGLRALDAGEAETALSIWTALAGQGDAAALYGLGRLYEIGRPGVSPDAARAAGYYREAAAAGLVAAQNNLALLYAKGEGVPRDAAMAASLWEQAAVRGHPTAQYNLGLLLLRGEGVAQDEAQGAVWVRKAADAGVPAAQFVMGDLRRYGMGLVQDPTAALDWYRRADAAGYGPARAEVRRLEAAGIPARTETASTEDSGSAAAGPAVGPAADAPGNRPLPPPALPVRLAPVPVARTVPAVALLRPLPSPPKPADLAQAEPLLEAPAPALPREALPSAAAGVPPGSGRFGLWLGSAGDEQAADRLRRSVSGRHGAALGELAVTVRRVEVAGLGTLYRVFAGTWPERAAAERACGRLRAADPVAFCSAAAY